MYKFIFILTLLPFLVTSQNIYSALHLNEQDDYNTIKPKRIIETNTFYNSNGKKIDTNIKTFDASGMLLNEERLDENGKLSSRLTYVNDTFLKLKLSRIFERWTQFGYTKEIAIYKYDSNNFLVNIIDKRLDGSILSKTKIINNDKGHPIELIVVAEDGSSFGKEIAEYLYDKNKVVKSIINNDGNILTSDTLKISFKKGYLMPDYTEKYNDKGDLIFWIRKNRDGSETIYEETYLYDEKGNITENKIFEVTIKSNGKKKREIDRIFRKKYTY